MWCGEQVAGSGLSAICYLLTGTCYLCEREENGGKNDGKKIIRQREQYAALR